LSCLFQYCEIRKSSSESSANWFDGRNLQVLNSPDSEGNGGDQSPEREEKDGSIASIESGPNTVSDLLGISPPWSGALRTTKTGSLFFKIHAGTFSTVVNVSTVFAHPISLPVFGGFLGLLRLLCFSFTLSEDTERGGDGSCTWGDYGTGSGGSESKCPGCEEAYSRDNSDDVLHCCCRGGVLNDSEMQELR